MQTSEVDDLGAAAEELEITRQAAEVAGLEIHEFVLPAEHDVVLAGIRLHYLDWGNPDRPSIVLLHGGGLTAHTYDLVCLALRPDYHCIALDQRGHGDSEWSPGMDYAIETQATDIARFVEYLGFDRCVLVGMSLGGLNSIVYAGTETSRLAGLVLIDVGPELRTAGTNRIADFISAPAELDSIEQFIERAMDFNPRRNPRLLRRSLTHNLRRLPNGKWTWKYDRRPGRYQADPAAREERTRKLWEAVARIDCPTLVVRGAESDVFHDEDAEKLTGRLPDGRWARIPQAGHTVQGDNPAGLVAELRRFFHEIGY